MRLITPRLHWREGVPEMAFFKLEEIVHEEAVARDPQRSKGRHGLRSELCLMFEGLFIA